MTQEKKFKARVRTRMARTGESYTTAKRNLEREDGASARLPTDSHEERKRQFRSECLATWKPLVDILAQRASRVEWTEPLRIVQVLNEISRRAPYNHTHFPSGGGLDLTGSALSWEDGCIEMRFDGTSKLVRPRRLVLTIPANDPTREWAFFWLDTERLEPSGVYDQIWRDHEELVEIERDYVNRRHWDSGVIEVEDGDAVIERPLPHGARLVTRYLRGSFLIVTKGAGYNIAENAYDGSHDRMDVDRFTQGIQNLLDDLHRRGAYGRDPEDEEPRLRLRIQPQLR